MFQNFIFDTSSNDSHGVVSVSFDSVDKTVSAGFNTELTTESISSGVRSYIITQNYSEPISFTMQLINCDGTKMTVYKQRELIKWLCHRGEYRWFNILEEDKTNYWYKVNISNPQLIGYGGVIGMEFTVTCNTPYAYTPVVNKTIVFTGANTSKSIIINTDTEDYVYPITSISLFSSGNLNIQNSTEMLNREFELDNCINGEQILIDSTIPSIQSNRVIHKVFNDCNKRWIRLMNGENVITSNLPCLMSLKYREVRLVGIL